MGTKQEVVCISESVHRRAKRGSFSVLTAPHNRHFDISRALLARTGLWWPKWELNRKWPVSWKLCIVAWNTAHFWTQQAYSRAPLARYGPWRLKWALNRKWPVSRKPCIIGRNGANFWTQRANIVGTLMYLEPVWPERALMAEMGTNLVCNLIPLQKLCILVSIFIPRWCFSVVFTGQKH